MAPVLPTATVNVLIGAFIALVTAVLIERWKIRRGRQKLRSALANEIWQIRLDLIYVVEALYVREVGEDARPQIKYGSLVDPLPPQDSLPYGIAESIYHAPGAHNDIPFMNWMMGNDHNGNDLEDEHNRT